MKHQPKRNISTTKNVPETNGIILNIGDIYAMSKNKVSFEILKITDVKNETFSAHMLDINPIEVTSYDVTYPKSNLVTYKVLPKNAYDKILKLYHLFYATANAVISTLE